MVDTDDTRRTTDDTRRTTPRVWHKLPTGELKKWGYHGNHRVTEASNIGKNTLARVFSV